MLSRFGVKNYKSLRDIDIPLSKIHVIIGQNDSGKTSLLQAISAFCRSTQPVMRLEQAFEGNWDGRELVYAGADVPKVTFLCQFLSSEKSPEVITGYGFTVVFPDMPGRLCTVESEWYTDGSGSKTEVKSANSNYSIVSFEGQQGLVEGLRATLKSIAKQLSAVGFYRFEPRTMAIPASIDQSRKFRMDPDGFGLPTLLDDILGHDAERFIQLSKEFCEFFPDFRRVRIQTEMASQRRFQQTGLHGSDQSMGKGIYFETRQGDVIRAQQASDGAILFLGFLSLLYLPTPPRILLIEEPEKGVYPKRLEEIVGLLKRAITARGDEEAPQIIITTHSPYILSQFTPDEVTLMSRRDGYVIARPLRDAPHITDRLGGGEFYLGELWYNLDEEELFQDADSAGSH